MHEDKLNNQIPILRFLNKHKWRIIIPVLFAAFYFALPRFLNDSVAVQQYIFITSSELNQSQLNAEVSDISDRILTDAFLQNLIVKYDLFADERQKGVEMDLLLNKVRNSLLVQLKINNLTEGIFVSLWIHFRNQKPQSVMDISNEIAAKFEENQNIQVMKYVTPPYDASPYRNWVFAADIMLRGLVLFSIPLILIWEIPNLCYSPKTKEIVFNPIKSDWQNELLEAKLKNQSWNALRINVYYTYAFLAAMWQKSPIGDLIEFISKIAK
ncbi:MAG: hypothetical protein H0W77_11490 [Acidobacteria bacterium]|nr:hypothetical protein [Acidobacteriota bacterium]